MGRELLGTNTFWTSAGRPYVIDVYQDGRDISLELRCLDEDLEEGKAHMDAMAKVLRASRRFRRIRTLSALQEPSDAPFGHSRPQ